MVPLELFYLLQRENNHQKQIGGVGFGKSYNIEHANCKEWKAKLFIYPNLNSASIEKVQLVDKTAGYTNLHACMRVIR